MSDYPSESDLARITEWPWADPAGLLDFVHSIWHWPTMATIEGGMSRLGTGGWSGNEDIITAIRANHMFWTLYWESSHRGGLHYFRRQPPAEP